MYLKCVNVKSIDCGFHPHAIYLIIYLHFHFFALVSRRSAALSSATQHAMIQIQNSAESGERCVLTLGSLYLLCCVRDKAGSYKKLFVQSEIMLESFYETSKLSYEKKIC